MFTFTIAMDPGCYALITPGGPKFYTVQWNMGGPEYLQEGHLRVLCSLHSLFGSLKGLIVVVLRKYIFLGKSEWNVARYFTHIFTSQR